MNVLSKQFKIKHFLEGRIMNAKSPWPFSEVRQRPPFAPLLRDKRTSDAPLPSFLIYEYTAYLRASSLPELSRSHCRNLSNTRLVLLILAVTKERGET
jgi:hypothetical protein